MANVKPSTAIHAGMRPAGVRPAGEPPRVISQPRVTAPPAPTITETPKLAVSAAALSTGFEDSTQYEPEVTPQDSSTERVELPSNFVFYEWDSLSVKRFGVMDQAKLARAVRHQNITTLLDVLSATCDRDVRTMVYPDFQALCVWHKHNSYTNSPSTVSWRSKYGVLGKVSVNNTGVRLKKLETTRAAYLQCKSEKALATSTCRDLELLSSGTLDEDMTYLFDKAQFIDTEPLRERIVELTKEGDRAASATARIEKLQKLGLTYWPEIDEFQKQFADFGVQEYVNVTLPESDFNPEIAIATLLEGDAGAVAEAQAIQAAVDADKKYAPKQEEVPLGFNLWSMFPYTGA